MSKPLHRHRSEQRRRPELPSPILWDPTEDLQILLNGRQGEQEIDTGFFENVTSLIPGKLTPPRFNPILNGYRDHDGNVYGGDYDRDGFNDLETDGLTRTVKWSIGDINLTSITDRSNVHRALHRGFRCLAGVVLQLLPQHRRRADFPGTATRWRHRQVEMGHGSLLPEARYQRQQRRDHPIPFVGPATTPGAEAGLLNPYTCESGLLLRLRPDRVPAQRSMDLIVGARYIEDENDFEYKTSIVRFSGSDCARFRRRLEPGQPVHAG